MGQRNDEDLPLLPDDAAALRRQAEALLSRKAAAALLAQSPEGIPQLLHELQVHQIELELQNEELRRIQQELEASRARYFDLYDLAPVGYVTLSAQGLIQEANLTATALLEVPRSALLSQPLSRFVAPGDQQIYYLHRRALMRAGGSQICELRMLRPKHAPFWARLEAMAVPGPTGEAATYRVVISDITARVEAEAAVRELNATLERRVDERTAALLVSEGQLRRTNAELVQALRLKDEFLAMMSHELRTPLSVVLSTAEALTEELYGPIGAPQRQALATLAQSGRHLLALLSDILDLSRITVGRESLELESLDVRLVCQIALQIVEADVHAKSIQLRHVIAPAIASVRADERRLTQILVNLLSNAVKFTPDGGEVGLEVVADAARQHLLFSVWDTGIGIERADQERIFEPFIQADTRLARQYGGVGLGLALVHRLTALHGGSVSLVSAIGQGSRFTVSLPWAVAENTVPAAIDAREAASPTWLRPPQVLIADDDEPTLMLYEDLLTRHGCRVIIARTGEEALVQIQEHRPDVVVLDIQMPEMDGLTVIRSIREDPSIAELPILVLTALAMLGDRERCLAAGANAYLSKPVHLHSLLTTLARLLPAVIADPNPATR